jgi:SpoVK/Ycf46/Vps4 family AAA+-type ATPase
MRKGRFDEIFFVDLPSPAAREAIFRIHLQKRSRTPAEFDLPRLVAESDGFSGAEIEQAISASLFAAFGQNKRPLTTQDILTTLSQSPPLSVTRAEKIAELRAWAQGRCLMAE